MPTRNQRQSLEPESSVIPNYGSGINQTKTLADGDIPALHIKKLFRMIVLSPTGSGKRNLLHHIIKASSNYVPLYDDLKEKLAGFVSFYDPDHIPSVNAIRKIANDVPELVVFDDLLSEKRLQRDVTSQFYYRGRHQKLLMLMLAHSYFALEKMIRLNCDLCFILRANAKRDLKMILKDFNIPISEPDFYEVYRRSMQQTGNDILIDSLRGHIRRNFDAKRTNRSAFEFSGRSQTFRTEMHMSAAVCSLGLAEFAVDFRVDEDFST
ncbi:hypothetical protein PybrP1_012535 [[Pythium] brassicae (nom. inval.)]|nr:hypothetical protein PybrP1_012535 [[Pythium] brassicae (nom. inval.)]